MIWKSSKNNNFELDKELNPSDLIGFYENAVQPFIILNGPNVIYVNKIFEETLGYTINELKTLNVEQLKNRIFPQDLPRFLKSFVNALNNPELGYSVEIRVFDKENNIHWFDVVFKSVKYNKSILVQIMGNDISQRKRVENALRNSEARYKAIIEDQTELIERWLPDGTITFINNRFCKYFGKEFKDVVGLNVFNSFSEEVRKMFLVRLDCLTDENPNIYLEEHIQNNRKNYLEWIDRAIKDSKGNIVEIQSVGRDITKVKEQDFILKIAKEEAEKAYKTKNEFMATISHELKTPLNSILGYAQILSNKKSLPDEITKSVNIIEDSGKHLQNLIDDILDFSILDSYKLQLENSQFNLSMFLNNLSSMVMFKAEQKGITFKKNYDVDETIFIETDEKRLRQVLLNVLDNSIKFTNSGEINFNVICKSESIYFSIEDCGIGIEDKDINKIFIPFNKLKNNIRVEGTGLGLTISKKLVELMGSKLNVESNINVGSKFWFSLNIPIYKKHNLLLNDINKTIIGYKGERRKVLIIDDNKENRFFLKQILKPIGFVIEEAEDGITGLEIADKFNPEIILVDLIMPELDGFETIKIIHKNISEKIICIAVTASILSDTLIRCNNAGIKNVIKKPIAIDVLLNTISKYIKIDWLYDDEKNENLNANNYYLDEEIQNQIKIALVKGDFSLLKKEIESIKLNDYNETAYLKLKSLSERFEIEAIHKFLEDIKENES